MSIDKSRRAGGARRLVGFGIPIFLANFLQVFYALTDMAVVGRYVGESGLAAVANGSIVAYLVGSVGTGLALGGAVLIGHYKGAGQTEAQREGLAALLILSLLAAGLVSPFCLVFAGNIFGGLNTPLAARPQAASYLALVCLGNPFFFCGTALSFSLRSLGDSRSPLYFMLLAGLINIALDFFLVGFLAWGVKGAAAATTAAQGGALAFSAAYLKRRKFIFDFNVSSFRFRLDQARRILRIGLPSMAQLLVINLSYLVITALINSYGLAAAAAAGIGLKICTLAVMPCWAVGQALTALAANCLGAGEPQAAEALARSALKLNVGLSAVLVLIIQIGAQALMSLFNPGAPEVVSEGVSYLRLCCSLGVIVYAAMYTFNCLATSAGAALIALGNSLLDSVLMRLVLIGLLLRAGGGLTGIYLGQALSAVVPALLGGAYFYSRRWQRKKLI